MCYQYTDQWVLESAMGGVAPPSYILLWEDLISRCEIYCLNTKNYYEFKRGYQQNLNSSQLTSQLTAILLNINTIHLSLQQVQQGILFKQMAIYKI